MGSKRYCCAAHAPGAINVTVAYPLDLIRTNIASSHEGGGARLGAGIVETASRYRAHGFAGLTRGLPATQLCRVQHRPPLRHLRDAEHEPYRSAFERAMFEAGAPPTTTDDTDVLAYSMVCGQCAGLVAPGTAAGSRAEGAITRLGRGRVSFWRVASDLVRIGGVKGGAGASRRLCRTPLGVGPCPRRELCASRPGDRSGRR